MPKEYFNRSHEVVFGINWATPNDFEGVNYDGHVQLNVKLNREWLEKLLEEHDSNDDGSITLYSNILNRYELQQVIKVTRKSRDQVHEADA